MSRAQRRFTSQCCSASLSLFVAACGATDNIEPPETLQVRVLELDGHAVRANDEPTANDEGAQNEELVAGGNSGFVSASSGGEFTATHTLRLRVARPAALAAAGALDVALSVLHGRLYAANATVEPRLRLLAQDSVELEARLERGWGDVRVWAESSQAESSQTAQAFGVSNALGLPLPSLAEVQGWSKRSPYAGEQVLVDCAAPRELRITGVTPEGFYVTDISETRGYASLFVHTEGTSQLRQGLRVTQLAGWVDEFYGLTELTSSGFALEAPALASRVPAPALLDDERWTPARLERWESSLVAIRDVRVAKWFGPALAHGAQFDTRRSNCDFNGDQRLDWSQGSAEASCALACATAPECTEWSQYQRFGTFKVSSRRGAALNIETANAAQIDAPHLAGRELGRVVGNLRHFEPGQPAFTIVLRRAADLEISAPSHARRGAGR